MVARSQMRRTSARRWVISTPAPAQLFPVRQQGEYALGLVGGQCGRDFVEQQHLRVAGEGAREVDDAQRLKRQPAHQRVQVELFKIEPVEPAGEGRLVDFAQLQVLPEGEVGYQRRVLEDRGDADSHCVQGRVELHRGPIDKELAGVSQMDAGQDFDERALAGPVRAQEGMNLAAAHGKVCRLQPPRRTHRI